MNESNHLEEELFNREMDEETLEQVEPDETGEPIAEVLEGRGLHAGPLDPNEEPISIEQIDPEGHQ